MARRSKERLTEVRERLFRWREVHGGRGRPIPEELWASAAAVAAVEGVSTTARMLGVDRARLERRVGSLSSMTVATRSVGRTAPPQATFVELPALQSPLGAQLVVRLTARDGEQMEILGGVDVLALAREFWIRAR